MCLVDGCSIVKNAGFGYCSKHYTRLRRHGSVTANAFHDLTVSERLRLNSTRNSNGCLMWNHLTRSNPYGTISISGKTYKPHRVAYKEWVGPLAEEDVVCHHCDTPGCIEPTHLFKGTQEDNIRDMLEKGRYKKGHTYQAENHVNAKLSRSIADEIRRRYLLSDERVTLRSLSIEYEVSITTVKEIVHNRRYQDRHFQNLLDQHIQQRATLRRK